MLDNEKENDKTENDKTENESEAKTIDEKYTIEESKAPEDEDS